MLVPTKQTKVSMLDFAKAVVATHHDLPKEAAGVLWAQFAAETANGVHCYGYNLGNVKWTQGCGLDHQALLGTWECFPAEKAEQLITSLQGVRDNTPGHACAEGCVPVVFSAANPITWFRVYPDLETGMRCFIAMKMSGRFGTAWPFVIAGDCDGFAKDLGTLKVRPGDKFPTAYFTASIDAYAKLMKVKHAEWMKSDAWEQATKEVEAGSFRATSPIELANEGTPTVDPFTEEPWVLDFEVVHPPVTWPSRPPREV